jgi:protein gp37
VYRTGLSDQEIQDRNLVQFIENEMEHPLKNVWCGTSVEDQATANDRIPRLREVRAAVRFISAEPLLGRIDLREACGYREVWMDWVICGGESGPRGRMMYPQWAESLCIQCRTYGVPFFFKQWGEWQPRDASPGTFQPSHALDIGPGVSARTRTFMVRVGKRVAGRLLDGREWNEYPAGAAQP